mmetsp:Transcript_20076/g.71009  ORF Transcript_20076/g.71009 Transcript_20076/m.71009 type:complete len:329 (-) Transcript_20076:1633-2619(-)
MAAHRRHHQRRRVVSSSTVDICAGRGKQIHGAGVAASRCERQGRAAPLVALVDVAAVADQTRQHSVVALGSGGVQRSLLLAVLGVDVHTCGQNELHRAGRASRCRGDERRAALGVLDVRARAGVDQFLRRLVLARAHRVEERRHAVGAAGAVDDGLAPEQLVHRRKVPAGRSRHERRDALARLVVDGVVADVDEAKDGSEVAAVNRGVDFGERGDDAGHGLGTRAGVVKLVLHGDVAGALRVALQVFDRLGARNLQLLGEATCVLAVCRPRHSAGALGEEQLNGLRPCRLDGGHERRLAGDIGVVDVDTLHAHQLLDDRGAAATSGVV